MARLPVAFACVAALAFGSAGSAHAFEWLGKIAEDAKSLASDNPQTRLSAVRALARYDIEWTRDDLLKALDDPDIHVRTAAGRALAKHGEAKALPILIKWLALPDSASKTVAASILGELKAKEALPALVRALGDLDPAVRVASTKALGQIGGPAVVVPLVSLLEDDKAEVRLAAIAELQAVGDSRAVIPLVGLFRTSTQRVRIAAISAVGKLGDPAATDALERELGASAVPLQLAAIGALGDLASPAATDRLIGLLGSGTTAIQGKAAFSLALIAKAHPANASAQKALGALVELLGSRSLRIAATEALRAAGDIAVPHLIAHLDGELRGDPRLAVELLEELGDASATPALIRELGRGRIPQAVVLGALSKLGDSRALLPILGLLDDPSPDVRIGAMRSLGPLLGEPSAAADLLAERLLDKEPEVRLMAARYLGTMRARSAVPQLVKLAADDDDFALQATSLQALGAIGDTRATQQALAGLSHERASIRDIAADVLAEIADPAARAPLFAIAERPEHPARALAIEALGANYRGTKNAKALEFFRQMLRAPDLATSLAAAEALGALGNARATAPLEVMLRHVDSERARAAARALGALGQASSAAALRSLLGDSGERGGAAAALALGQLGDSEAFEALRALVRRPGTGRAVNASAALALMATKENLGEVITLLRNANPLVRVNAVAAIAKVGSKAHTKTLEGLVADDGSWLVRLAAVRTLSLLGAGLEVRTEAAKADPRPEVRQAAALSLQRGYTRSTNSRWAVFRIVDPLREDAPVLYDGRFFYGADGIVRAGFSDLRGRISFENFPEGDYIEGSLGALSGY